MHLRDYAIAFVETSNFCYCQKTFWIWETRVPPQGWGVSTDIEKIREHWEVFFACLQDEFIRKLCMLMCIPLWWTLDNCKCWASLGR